MNLLAFRAATETSTDERFPRSFVTMSGAQIAGTIANLVYPTEADPINACSVCKRFECACARRV